MKLLSVLLKPNLRIFIINNASVQVVFSNGKINSVFPSVRVEVVNFHRVRHLIGFRQPANYVNQIVDPAASKIASSHFHWGHHNEPV